MIITDRLHLIPGSTETVRSAIEDVAALGVQLDAIIPPSWPPDLLDRDALEWTLRWLSEPSNDPAWGFYWVVLRKPRTLVGVVGYKGMPKDGSVEVGYGVVSEHRRRGYATEATRALIDRAFATPGVTRVIAETLPGLEPSIGVLAKCGFSLIGPGSEEGTIRYEFVRMQRQGV
ncbi:MAG: GNAT family N-acetyltransferase [Gemmatimonadaceae bacterium]